MDILENLRKALDGDAPSNDNQWEDGAGVGWAKTDKNGEPFFTITLDRDMSKNDVINVFPIKPENRKNENSPHFRVSYLAKAKLEEAKHTGQVIGRQIAEVFAAVLTGSAGTKSEGESPFG